MAFPGIRGRTHPADRPPTPTTERRALSAPQAMADFWVEVEDGKFQKALTALQLANGQLASKYNQVVTRYRNGRIPTKDQILPIKPFASFISEAVEKTAFVHMRASKGDATGVQSFAKSMKGFLTHYASALANESISPPEVFSDLLRERAKALLNVAKVAAQDDDGDPVRLFGACRCLS